MFRLVPGITSNGLIAVQSYFSWSFSLFLNSYSLETIRATSLWCYPVFTQSPSDKPHRPVLKFRRSVLTVIASDVTHCSAPTGIWLFPFFFLLLTHVINSRNTFSVLAATTSFTSARHAHSGAHRATRASLRLAYIPNWHLLVSASPQQSSSSCCCNPFGMQQSWFLSD